MSTNVYSVHRALVATAEPGPAMDAGPIEPPADAGLDAAGPGLDAAAPDGQTPDPDAAAPDGRTLDSDAAPADGRTPDPDAAPEPVIDAMSPRADSGCDCGAANQENGSPPLFVALLLGLTLLSRRRR